MHVHRRGVAGRGDAVAAGGKPEQAREFQAGADVDRRRPRALFHPAYVAHELQVVAQAAPVAPDQQALAFEGFAVPHRHRRHQVGAAPQQLVARAQEVESAFVGAGEKQHLGQVVARRQVVGGDVQRVLEPADGVARIVQFGRHRAHGIEGLGMVRAQVERGAQHGARLGRSPRVRTARRRTARQHVGVLRIAVGRVRATRGRRRRLRRAAGGRAQLVQREWRRRGRGRGGAAG